MRLKKIFDICKKKKTVSILNISGGVLFCSDDSIYLVKDMPSILSLQEFGAIFEIDADELSKWKISIDEESVKLRGFKSIERGIGLERGGSLSFGSLRCILFKKADRRQLSFTEPEESPEKQFEGCIAADPEKLSPIRDGIISFEFISFLGKGCICALENGAPCAVIEPCEINEENISFINTVAEELTKFYI